MQFLTTDPIQLDALVRRVSTARRGGVSTFLGLVRNHHGGRAVRSLSYSAYEPMAEQVCAEILSEAEGRWNVAAALQHRLGDLAIGEVAVAIAVAGDHRDEAFAACRYIIEELKHRVPVWKKELYEDGTVTWVEPQGAVSGEREAETPA